MIFETNTQKSDITSAGGDGSGERADRRDQPVVYFVLPCYNEAEGLVHTADVLAAKVAHLTETGRISKQSRILFVDDGSKDDTWSIIRNLHERDAHLFGGVKLSHNRGHQNALLAGLMTARAYGCDAAISMDADLQDDVNAVDGFIDGFCNGDEIVYGVRSARKKDTWFKRTTAEAFYKVFEWMGAETVPDHADYRLMSRETLDALSEYHEVNLFLRGIVPTLGYQTSKVYYERGEREAGESKYPLKKMIARAYGCDAAISMDADLQDDVNAVDGFIDGFCNGDEIVYGVRSARKKDTWFKRTTAEAFYKVFEWMGAETVPDHADYRLMSRETLDALSEYHEVNLFLRGIVPTLGYQTSKVYYERGEREAGESKYPLKKMIAFAIQGITSFSTKPLSFVTGAGLLSILVAIGMFVYVLVSLGFGHAIAGWGSMMISIWLIGGLIMLSLGIVGEYVGKIYMESKHRPRYRIETTL